ncbi:hypothetical protein L596_001185 [Steinernema carpocapsae]|uniref:Uncharacterized protein n=1 Tax=Steinernema carpocapsae TaxID=34508 RepID=A0A4U8UKV0_STECR|nr:hypothetical protein L596_001185 [Steinernema carpocapsae]
MDTTPSLMAVVSIRPNVPEMDPCFLTARTRVPRTADVAEDMLPTTSKLKPGPPSSPPNATISTADMSASRSTSDCTLPNDMTCWSIGSGRINCTLTDNVVYLHTRSRRSYRTNYNHGSSGYNTGRNNGGQTLCRNVNGGELCENVENYDSQCRDRANGGRLCNTAPIVYDNSRTTSASPTTQSNHLRRRRHKPTEQITALKYPLTIVSDDTTYIFASSSATYLKHIQNV